MRQVILPTSTKIGPTRPPKSKVKLWAIVFLEEFAVAKILSYFLFHLKEKNWNIP